MEDELPEPRITTDADILGGKPVIAGTRISVSLVLEKLRVGWCIDEPLEEYPRLTDDHVTAALAYAAEHMGAPVVSRSSCSMRASRGGLTRGDHVCGSRSTLRLACWTPFG